jgi:hypothetical protein
METDLPHAPAMPHDGLSVRDLVIVLLVVVVTTAAIGIPYWTADYAGIRDDGIFGAFLEVSVALFLGAFLAGAVSEAPLWLVGLGMLTATPVVVMVRVAVDTAADPTSHNLWPLEVVFSGAMAAPSVGLGVAVAWAVRVLTAPRR